MVFSSLIFLFTFLGITLAVYYLMKPLPIIYRNIWLFLVSIFFYAWGEPKFFVVILCSIVMNYFWGLAVDRYRHAKGIKWLLGVAVGSNLLILFIFKYLNFSVGIINALVGDILTPPGIHLPIGISFFTFQAISYVIDVYRGQGKVQKNILNVGLYIAFFPQLVAGPIVRYDTVAEQLAERKENCADFAVGIERFLIGFCKKILLANIFGLMADEVFDNIWKDVTSVDLAWVGAIAYSFQILFDFSGYSDMAIGLGKMFGFHFEENFHYPYVACSVSDFWRRWHISLGSWFRDYVYIPLGGSRVKTKRHVCNLAVVWILTGIWHGANWTFIIWGVFYFVLIVFEKMTGVPNKLRYTWAKIIYQIITLLSIVGGWVIFRCETLGALYKYVKALFGLGSRSVHDTRVVFFFKEYWIFWIVAILLCIPMPEKVSRWFSKAEVLKPIVMIALFIVGISFLVLLDHNPFIYFNF